MEAVVRAVDGKGATVNCIGTFPLDALLADSILFSLCGWGFCRGGPAAPPTAHLSGIAAGGQLHAGAAIPGVQVKGPSIDLKGSLSADSISLCGDGEAAVCDIKGAQGGVIAVLGMDTILACGDGKGPAGNGDTVLAGQTVAGGSDGVAAAGDHQVVFRPRVRRQR